VVDRLDLRVLGALFMDTLICNVVDRLDLRVLGALFMDTLICNVVDRLDLRVLGALFMDTLFCSIISVGFKSLTVQSWIYWTLTKAQHLHRLHRTLRNPT